MYTFLLRWFSASEWTCWHFIRLLFIKSHEKLRISGLVFDSTTQKNLNFKKVSLILDDHNAMNGPLFFSQPNQFFFLTVFYRCQYIQNKVKQVSEIPNFSLMNMFRSLGQRNPKKNVMKIWWSRVFDNKNFQAYQKARQKYYWHRDKKDNQAENCRTKCYPIFSMVGVCWNVCTAIDGQRQLWTDISCYFKKNFPDLTVFFCGVESKSAKLKAPPLKSQRPKSPKLLNKVTMVSIT